MSFDWTKVEGYREDMTAEEKLSLLDAQDSPEEPAPKDEPTPSPKPASATVSKAMYDKVSSELAKAKKDLRARMTVDEQAEQERREREEANQLELETLRKEKLLNGYKASYLAQGYDEAMAEEAASAMADGDMDTVFAVMKKHSVASEKALRAKILKETPVPPAGDDPNDELKKKKETNDLRACFGLPPLR